MLLASGNMISPAHLVLTKAALKLINLSAKFSIFNIATVLSHRFELLLFPSVLLNGFTKDANDLKEIGIALHFALEILQSDTIHLL